MSGSRHIETRKTCLAFSPGGHWAELSRAVEGITFTDCFHVSFDDGRPRQPSPAPRYHICHPRRSVWRTCRNAWQSFRIVLRERPELVISTGADVAVATVIIAKLLGATTVFIETAGSAGPTLSGRLVYPFSDLFIVQWPECRAAFPKAVLAEGLLL